MLYSIPNYSIFPIQYCSYQFHLLAIFFSILAMQLHIHDFYSPAVSFMQIPFWYRCGVEKLRYVQIVRLCHQNWVRIMRSFLFLISYENWKLYAINCMSYRLSVGFQCGVSQTLMFFYTLVNIFLCSILNCSRSKLYGLFSKFCSVCRVLNVYFFWKCKGQFLKCVLKSRSWNEKMTF